MKPVPVYCHTDEASMKGADIPVKKGFKPVYRLQGNYKARVDAGYPTEKQVKYSRRRRNASFRFLIKRDKSPGFRLN